MLLQPIWAWAILGLVLLSIELLSGTFYILWFAISALCVSLMLLVFPEASVAMQLLAFSLLSLVTLGLWRRKYRQQGPAPVIGQSRDGTIGQTGRITVAVSPEQNGTIAFTVPVMGSREWTATSDEAINAGETAEITAIEGNYLRVRRVSG